VVEGHRPNAIDLFCGAGGMSLGFEQAGFEIVAAVDRDPIHAATHAANFPHCATLCEDVRGLSADDLRAAARLDAGTVDVLLGGPPCGGFSLIGKRRRDDPRNDLIFEFARLVAEMMPRYFVVENVPGILCGESKDLVQRCLAEMRAVGYGIAEPVRALGASDFGVPQRRARVFLLGHRSDVPEPRYPDPRSDDALSGGPPRPTVWDAIGDLSGLHDVPETLTADVYEGELGPPSDYAKVLRGLVRDPDDRSGRTPAPSDGLTGCARSAHSVQVMRRYATTEPGAREPVSRFVRLSKDGLSPTLRAGTDRQRGSFTAPRPIHPVYPHCITVREAARLHSFPDWFRFHPTKWHGFRQIGNSVPPLLARAVAVEVRACLSEPSDAD